jgi:transcriptional regulator with XRE-family HTH domain
MAPLDPLSRSVCKAARALLDWTASDLAQTAGMSADTIRSFESGRTKTLSRENERTVRSAFERAGVVFIEENGGGAGVRLRKPRSGEDRV